MMKVPDSSRMVEGSRRSSQDEADAGSVSNRASSDASRRPPAATTPHLRAPQQPSSISAIPSPPYSIKSPPSPPRTPRPSFSTPGYRCAGTRTGARTLRDFGEIGAPELEMLGSPKWKQARAERGICAWPVHRDPGRRRRSTETSRCAA